MYSIKVCDAVIGDAQPRLTTKQVGKGIARATLKHIPHDTYLAMFREGQQEILSNKRIGSKLHTISQWTCKTVGLFHTTTSAFSLRTCLMTNRIRTPTRSVTSRLKRYGCPSPNSRPLVRRW